MLPVVEVEFSDLRWDSEMRPRSSTWEFSMILGALFVRDKLTIGTLFPALVCPQGRESQVHDLVLLFFCNQVLVAKNIQLLLSRNWNCQVY